MTFSDTIRNSKFNYTRAIHFFLTKETLNFQRQMSDYSALFNTIDADKDGKITEEEFMKHVATNDSVNKEVLHLIFQALDADKDGHLTEAEFVKFGDKVKTMDSSAQDYPYKLLFSLIDENSDGHLTFKEVKTFSKNNGFLQNFSVNKFIAQADANGDGIITYDEFLSFFK